MGAAPKGMHLRRLPAADGVQSLHFLGGELHLAGVHQRGDPLTAHPLNPLRNSLTAFPRRRVRAWSASTACWRSARSARRPRSASMALQSIGGPAVVAAVESYLVQGAAGVGREEVGKLLQQLARRQ